MCNEKLGSKTPYTTTTTPNTLQPEKPGGQTWKKGKVNNLQKHSPIPPGQCKPGPSHASPAHASFRGTDIFRSGEALPRCCCNCRSRSISTASSARRCCSQGAVPGPPPPNWEHANVPICQMHQCVNVSMCQCAVCQCAECQCASQRAKYANVPMTVPMCHCANVPICVLVCQYAKCANMPICQYVNVPMC